MVLFSLSKYIRVKYQFKCLHFQNLIYITCQKSQNISVQLPKTQYFEKQFRILNIASYLKLEYNSAF